MPKVRKNLIGADTLWFTCKWLKRMYKAILYEFLKCCKYYGEVRFGEFAGVYYGK